MMNMESIPQVKKEVSVGEAQAYLMGKLAEMHATGNMDSEPEAVLNIQKQLADGNMSPDDAIKQVDTMISQRQSYH